MYNITLVFVFQTAAAVTIGYLFAQAIIYLFKAFLEQRINEFFQERGIVRTSRRVIHNEIIKICSEGKSSGWQISPRALEHCYFIANTTKTWNFDLGTKVNDYLTTWITYSGLGRYLVKAGPEMTNLLNATKKKLNLLDIAILHGASKEFQIKKKN